MIKLIIFAPLFFSTLFLSSFVNVSLIDLINNNYRNRNLLISYGGGGGGGGGSLNSTRIKAKEKAKLLFKKRQAEKKAAEGMPLTEEEKKLLNLTKFQIN